MNFTRLNWVTVSVLLASSLSAANEPALDAEFKLKQPEGYCAWQITHSYAKLNLKDAKGAPLPEPDSYGIKHATLTMTPPLWREVVEDTRGDVIEFWFDGSTTFYKSNRDPLLRTTSGMAGLQPVMGDKGFRDLAWANEKTFTGRQKLGTRQCLVFAKDDMKLWVDAGTHYPARWQRGNETRDYQQLPAPTDALIMPADIAREAEAMAHDMELYKRPVPKLGRGLRQ
ncbi:MAG: hypothetical protein LBD30_09415 [Verrucomicrobiales bacterium]|jgi:hypothetical protein|nr:hypothetical protein [Verrucomicrobiales bacterium]